MAVPPMTASREATWLMELFGPFCMNVDDAVALAALLAGCGR